MELPRYSMLVASHVLIFVLKGDKVIHLPGHDLVIRPGNWVFIPRGFYLFSEVHPDAQGFERVVLFFRDRFLYDFVAANPLPPAKSTASSPPLPFGDITPVLDQTLETLRGYFSNRSQLQQHLMRTKLHEILLNILESDATGAFAAHVSLITGAQSGTLGSLMHRHVTEPLTVQEFAHLCCRSQRQFLRDFVGHFGEPPVEWIRKRRLKNAHRLILTSDLPITEICFRSGFTSFSYFIQLFKAHFGITPKQLQLQNRHILA